MHPLKKMSMSFMFICFSSFLMPFILYVFLTSFLHQSDSFASCGREEKSCGRC